VGYAAADTHIVFFLIRGVKSWPPIRRGDEVELDCKAVTGGNRGIDRMRVHACLAGDYIWGILDAKDVPGFSRAKNNALQISDLRKNGHPYIFREVTSD